MVALLTAGRRSLVARVERKSVPDLISSITGSALKYAMDRYAAIFKRDRIRPATFAELQVTWPAVPIVFADTRPLAEEWTYCFLAAAAGTQATTPMPWTGGPTSGARATPGSRTRRCGNPCLGTRRRSGHGHGWPHSSATSACPRH